jgi:nucleoid-associated protein
MGLEELSELIDEERPKAFYDHIRNKDYGLSPEIPADKRTLNQFRRFTGRAEGLSISFEAHLLGSKVEFDEEAGTLIIKGLPTQLLDQLKRNKLMFGGVLKKVLFVLVVVVIFQNWGKIERLLNPSQV